MGQRQIQTIIDADGRVGARSRVWSIEHDTCPASGDESHKTANSTSIRQSKIRVSRCHNT